MQRDLRVPFCCYALNAAHTARHSGDRSKQRFLPGCLRALLYCQSCSACLAAWFIGCASRPVGVRLMLYTA